MKVTVEQLKAISPSAKVTYKVDHPRELGNIRQLASYVSFNYPELGIKFKSCIKRAKMEITLEAVSTEIPKARKK